MIVLVTFIACNTFEVDTYKGACYAFLISIAVDVHKISQSKQNN